MIIVGPSVHWEIIREVILLVVDFYYKNFWTNLIQPFPPSLRLGANLHEGNFWDEILGVKISWDAISSHAKSNRLPSYPLLYMFCFNFLEASEFFLNMIDKWKPNWVTQDVFHCVSHHLLNKVKPYILHF